MRVIYYAIHKLMLSVVLFSLLSTISTAGANAAQIIDSPFEGELSVDPKVKNLFCQDLRDFGSKQKRTDSSVCGYFTDLDLVKWKGRKKDSHSKASLALADHTFSSTAQSFYLNPLNQEATRSRLDKVKKTIVNFCCQGNNVCEEAFVKVGNKFCGDSGSVEKCNSNYVHYENSEEEFFLKWWNMNVLRQGEKALLPTIQDYAPQLIEHLGKVASGSMIMPENQYVDDPLRQDYFFAHELGHACLSIRAQIEAGHPKNLTFYPSTGGPETEEYCKFGHKNFNQLLVLGIGTTDREYKELRSCVEETIHQEYLSNQKLKHPLEFCYGSKFEESMADAIALLTSTSSLGIVLDTMCMTLSDEVHLKGSSLMKCLISHSVHFRQKLARSFQCSAI